MDEKILAQLQRWHEDDCFQEIIEAIEALPQDKLDDDLRGQLARALNNRGQEGDYQRAIDLLLEMQERKEQDAIWQFRLGYAYYYLDREEEAAACFERVLDLEIFDQELVEDAKELLGSCHEFIQQKAGHFQGDYAPEVYELEQLELVEQHITKHFGEYQSVFHEIVSPDIHVDLCLIPPTAERPYHVIVTMGMGAHRMNVPAELADKKLERAELCICLPQEWKLNNSDECWYWPLRTLKSLARLPGQADTWLGWGHTVDNQAPYAGNTELCGAMLISTFRFGAESNVCPLPGGDEVNFYQVAPLYREEMEYKTAHGAETLMELFPQNPDEILVVNPTRTNVCQNMPVNDKNFAIPNSKMRQLLTDWEEAEGCLATDRILVDGCPVGYCYREEPMEDVPDSGWRFMAGDEDQDYMDDSSKSGIYSLNTLCNYDPGILEILHAPVGSAFHRDASGKLVPMAIS